MIKRVIKLGTFLGLFVMAGIFFASPAKADYYAQGILESNNVLSGADITNINNFVVVADIPASTSVSVSFSQDKWLYYNASGTKGAWNVCTNGTTTIDLSGLGWTGALLFYKLKLETTNASVTPVVKEIHVNYNGTPVPAATSTRYYGWGVVVSDNMLSGATVDAIHSFQATTSLPAGTKAFISFSQDKRLFYNASGTKGAWDELLDGGNVINLDGLAWSGASFYYKIRLEALPDPALQPKITEVKVIYDGTDVPPVPTSSYNWMGTLVSSDLLASSSEPLTGFERFGYAISYLPYGATVKAQFSVDGIHWYSSDGTPWGYDVLSAGDHTGPEGSIDLSGLDWKGQTSFYYKIKFILGADNHFSPILKRAGLVLYSAYTTSGTKGNPPILHLKFNEGYGSVAHDESGNGYNATLYPGTGGSNTTASAMWSLEGRFGRAIELDGTDDYLISSFKFENLGQFSISQFINFQTLAAGKPIISQWGGVQNAVLVKIDDIANDEIKVCIASSTTDNCANYGVTQNANLSANNWYNLQIVYNGDESDNASRLKIYLNGEAQALDFTGAIPASLADSSQNLEIGGDSDLGQYVNALIDEVKIWNYALSEDKVKIEYNQGASLIMGSVSTATGSSIQFSNAASRQYCVLGDTSYCAPPVLELKFDEKQGITAYDISGNSNDGIINGASWTRGKLGSALSFDGVDDYVISNFQFNNLNKFSIFWFINFQTLAAGKPIISQWGNNQNAILIKIDDINSDEIKICIASSTTDNCANYGVSTDANIRVNNWYNLEIVYDGEQSGNVDKLKLYLNGIKKNLSFSGIIPANILINSNESLELGGDSDLSLFSNLKIDNLRIYDYARTSAQVAWDYNRGKPIAWWRFDECSGEIIHDESGNGNHGALHLGASGVTATGICSSSSNSFWYNGKNGKINSGGNFDGVDDYVDFGDIDIINSLTEGSLSAWFKVESATDNRTIISNYDGTTQEGLGLQYTSIGKINVETKNNNVHVCSFNTRDTFNLNEWIHVVYIVSDSGNNLYVNGKLQPVDYSAGNQSTSIFFGDLVVNSLNIGYRDLNNSTYYDYFDGFIDEVKIWNYALTEEQVKQEYNGGAVRFGG